MITKNKEEKLYYAWNKTMHEITTSNKNNNIIDIFYSHLATYFSYKEIASLLGVAIQSVYNYNQLKGESKTNNNVRKQLAVLFVELLDQYEIYLEQEVKE